jgi:hypothetical protein
MFIKGYAHQLFHNVVSLTLQESQNICQPGDMKPHSQTFLTFRK